MSKRAGGKRERFLALRFWLLKSSAWRSLPGNARAIYIEIAARYYGSNNGRISYSVREAAEALRISKPTACRMLRLLQERGFIVCTKRGAFSRKTVREASEWCLTEHNSDCPVAHATKDFMHGSPWKSPEKIKTRFHRKTRTGSPRNPYGFTRKPVKPKKGSDGFTTKPANNQN